MKNLFLFSVALFTILLNGVSSAQNSSDINFKLNDKVIANFIMAINSDNVGLKKSAIYLVSNYKIEGAVDALINVLNTDNSGSIKVLAALALYEIGSAKGLNAVLKSAVMDNNEFVRKMNSIIYIDYKQRFANGKSF